MSFLALIARSVRFHGRATASVFAGVALASAVLTGALIMGDSVDYSLRAIALARLGNVHYAMETPNRFFDQALVRKLDARLDTDTAAILHLSGMAVRQEGGGHRAQVNQVQILGVDDGFGSLAGAEALVLGENDVAVNEKLAAALGVVVGDRVSLRVIRPSLMPLDAPLSPRDDDRLASALLAITAVLPDSGAGRFSLVSDQIAPYNAFLDLGRLQRLVDAEGKANMVLAGDGTSATDLDRALRIAWQPEDLGLRWRTDAQGVLQLESDRVFLDEAVAEAALDTAGAVGTLAYLVNSIASNHGTTPYSFAVAGPVLHDLGHDAAVVNAWLAEQLGIGLGDTIRVAYYEVTPANSFVERQRFFTVAEVRSMEAMATERDLVPEFPGLSDVESCRDWSIGMPMEEEALRDEANEAYWHDYRQTPKILVSLEAGHAMWANRFGRYTAVRWPAGTPPPDTLRTTIRNRVDPEAMGLQFVAAREQALQAVDQAIDFGGLFVGISFFLIAAALLLTAVLFVFGIQQRSEEFGILLAVGFRPRHLRRLILAEGAAIAAAGAVAGALGGTVYARLLIAGLRWLWEAAVAHTAIAYHARPVTLVEGAAIGFVCAIIAIAVAGWRHARESAATLLSADFLQAPAHHRGRAHYRARSLAPILGMAAGAGWAAHVLLAAPANAAPSFFGIGAVLLASGLTLWHVMIDALGARPPSRRFSMTTLAIHPIAGRPGRSTAVAGLLACGVFLVLSVASMRQDLAAHAHERSSGTGGFALFAQTTAPIEDPAIVAGDEPNVAVVPLRVHGGDDASCLNLNRGPTPRLLGVDPQVMGALRAFDRRDADESLWRLLEGDHADGVIPALVGDTDTAMWGLKAKVGADNGDVVAYRDEAGNDVSVKLVGTLPMRLSVFQGSVLVSQADFTRLYPSENGFRVFLIDAPDEIRDRVAARLREAFGRSGMDVVSAIERLREFYAVESTYLAMFLALGGMGVTLGSLGMGVVMLRNLLERRGELAMLGAVGFRTRDILRLLVVEHATLLLAAAAIGGGAAAVSMIPAVTVSATKLPLAFEAGMLILIIGCGMASMAVALRLGRPGDYLAALRDE